MIHCRPLNARSYMAMQDFNLLEVDVARVVVAVVSKGGSSGG